MAINRAAIKKQLQEGLNAVFGLEYNQYPELWKDIFTASKEAKKAYVEDVLMTGFGAAPTKACRDPRDARPNAGSVEPLQDRAGRPRSSRRTSRQGVRSMARER